MTKITRKIKQFITKTYNVEKDNYCWYNTQVKLSGRYKRTIITS